MILTGSTGAELESIRCGIIDNNVIETDKKGDQVQGRIGLAVEVNQRGVFNGMPDDCPLYKPEPTRSLGDFTVCNSCQLAEVTEAASRPIA